MAFFKGYLYNNVCTLYLFISHDCYHVPLKLREINDILHSFTLNGQPKAQNMSITKTYSMGTKCSIKWTGTTLSMNSQKNWFAWTT